MASPWWCACAAACLGRCEKGNVEVRRILSDDASPLIYFVDCSHKVPETPSGVRFVSGTFILFLVYFWASDVQEHFNTAIRSQATAFHRYCTIGGFMFTWDAHSMLIVFKPPPHHSCLHRPGNLDWDFLSCRWSPNTESHQRGLLRIREGNEEMKWCL